MANTLNLGNGDWATKENSLLGYNSENGNYKPLPFDFTRASNATFVNKSGLIKTAANGVPRIDFSDSTSGALLLEPQRTNSLLQSNQFDTTWLKNNVTILGGQSGIYGSSDAWLLQRGDGLARFLYQNVSISSSSTLSVYAKKGNSDWLFLSSGAGENKYFDLENGVIGNVGTASNSEIESVGNGWYRCSITVSNGESRIYPAVGDGVVSGLVGANIYIQYAQLEAGSYATSLINTQGSAVTRVGDLCTNGGNDQVINSTEGVLYAEISALANDGTYRGLCLSNGSASNRVLIYLNNGTNQLRANVVAQGNLQANLIYTVSDVTILNKVAIKWSLNNVSFWINGSKVLQDLDAPLMPTGLNELSFDSNGLGGEKFYGNVKDLKVYNTVLTDAELQALTS